MIRNEGEGKEVMKNEGGQEGGEGKENTFSIIRPAKCLGETGINDMPKSDLWLGKDVP